MISKTGMHAVNAVATLALLSDGRFAGAAEIADRIGAPRNYLGKLLKVLADNGLLDSQKGKGGGFRLSRDAGRISLYEIMEPIDHVSRWGGCFLGRARCSDHTPCALHQRWSTVRRAYIQFLQETTVADVAGRQRLEDAIATR